MEVILFASLYLAIEVLIFYVHFLKKNFLLMWRGRGVVPFLSYEKGFSGENSEVYTDALRGHSAPRGWILHYRGCIHLTATSSGRFTLFIPSHWYALKVFLRTIRGLLLQVGVSLTVLNNRWSRRPGGKHKEDSLRPAGLNHCLVPLVRLAVQH